MNAPRPIRSFLQILGLLDKGRFEEACDNVLNEAIETLEATQKDKGKAIIKIEVEIAYESGRIDIHPKIVSKLPEDKIFGRTPFWTIEGAVSTQHPSQHDMFQPRAVPANTEPSDG